MSSQNRKPLLVYDVIFCQKADVISLDYFIQIVDG